MMLHCVGCLLGHLLRVIVLTRSLAVLDAIAANYRVGEHQMSPVNDDLPSNPALRGILCRISCPNATHLPTVHKLRRRMIQERKQCFRYRCAIACGCLAVPASISRSPTCGSFIFCRATLTLRPCLQQQMGRQQTAVPNILLSGRSRPRTAGPTTAALAAPSRRRPPRRARSRRRRRRCHPLLRDVHASYRLSNWLPFTR